MKSLKTRAFGWLWRSVLAGVLVLIVAGTAAPFVNASFFAPHIQRALEASLNRKVKFDAVHLSVFSGPGFSLSDVNIDEDPSFGFEPFASVPTLQARLRLGTLLRGHVAFSSLRLIDPSLNLVKRRDGAWNAVELLGRLTAESSLPIDVFPVFSVSGGRIDIKFGEQKETVYLADTDLSVYPERSGKLFVRFSGAPARTDRSGNGFGHLHGAINWYRAPVTPQANQIEADLTLDASNLSDLSTLFEGQDAGVHGTIASHALVEGPLDALRIEGNVTLADVHRWDLLPLESGDWNTHYSGEINAADQSLNLRTVSANGANPLALQLRVDKFLTQPVWSVLASLNDAPTSDLLPLGRRMGLPLPPDFKIGGTVAGAIGYSDVAGFSGSIELRNVSAGVSNAPALRTDSLIARVANGSVTFQPTQIQTDENGSMLIGGEYDFIPRRTIVSVQPADLSVAALRATVGDWFGTPEAVDAFQSGTISGQLQFSHTGDDPPQWAGQVTFQNAGLQVTGLPRPLLRSGGQLRFDADSLDFDRVSGDFGHATVSASYHAAGVTTSGNRLRLVADSADLHDLESALAPAIRADGVLERLGVASRKIPSWLADRHVQGDIAIRNFSINGLPMGALHTRLLWNGTNVQIPSFALDLPYGAVSGSGTLDLVSTTPRYEFAGYLNGLHWHGGLLDAIGTIHTSGVGSEAIQHLRAEGTFKGTDVDLSADDAFSKMSGSFVLSFTDGWPDLKIQQLEASENDGEWTGTASSRDDGRLIIDLEREGRQRRVTSALQTPAPPASSLRDPEVRASTHTPEAVR